MLRRTLLADIHGNLEALQAVLADAQSQEVTEIYCLGDVIGYGPDPLACIDLAMTFEMTLLGNHDQAVLFDPDGFCPIALAAVLWTRRQIERSPQSTRYWDWLGERPFQWRETDRLYVHGSPRQPTNEYVFPETSSMNASWSRCSSVSKSIASKGTPTSPAFSPRTINSLRPRNAIMSSRCLPAR